MDHEAFLAELLDAARDTTAEPDIYTRLGQCDDNDLITLYRLTHSERLLPGWTRTDIIEDIATALEMQVENELDDIMENGWDEPA